eukprot:SAG22_NODE_6009_length_916_cov_1.659731_1_plen_182_part_00
MPTLLRRLAAAAHVTAACQAQAAGGTGGFLAADGAMCGGECNTGTDCPRGTSPANDCPGIIHYAYMGDDDFEECERKCIEMECKCFDHADVDPTNPNNKKVREGQHCRICPPSMNFMPLQQSNWGYEALRIPEVDDVRPPPPPPSLLGAGRWPVCLRRCQHRCTMSLLLHPAPPLPPRIAG